MTSGWATSRSIARPPPWREARRSGSGAPPPSAPTSPARAPSLKQADVRFPLGVFTCVTGVSGSGKSTLVNDILLAALLRHFGGTGPLPGEHRSIRGVEQIDKVIAIDQSPIGRTPRSNP